MVVHSFGHSFMQLLGVSGLDLSHKHPIKRVKKNSGRSNGRTDGRTNGRTDPLIEMRKPHLKTVLLIEKRG
jgi:hypothetical protein